MATRSRSGQSLIELLVGIAVGTVFMIGAAATVAPSLQIDRQAGNVQAEAQIGQDMANNVQSWAAADWSGVLALATGTANTYVLDTSLSPFSATVADASNTAVSVCSGGNGSSSCMTFERYFYLSDAYRDANGNLTSTAVGNYYDPSTKFVMVIVTASTTGAKELTIPFYVARTDNQTFYQSSWSGGSVSSGPVTLASATYSSSYNVIINTTGSIMLSGSPGASCVL